MALPNPLPKLAVKDLHCIEVLSLGACRIYAVGASPSQGSLSTPDACR